MNERKRAGVNSTALSKPCQETCRTSQDRGVAWRLCIAQTTPEKEETKNVQTTRKELHLKEAGEKMLNISLPDWFFWFKFKEK